MRPFKGLCIEGPSHGYKSSLKSRAVGRKLLGKQSGQNIVREEGSVTYRFLAADLKVLESKTYQKHTKNNSYKTNQNPIQSYNCL